MIPFIYVFDGGECVKEISRPPEIQVLADQFISRGGRYVITLFVDDVVEARAVVLGLEEPIAVAEQKVPNGPLLLGAIDRLVKESVRQLDQLQ